MMSVTGGTPKELLPLGSKPVLARVVEEAREGGMDGVVIINSRNKTEVDDAIDEWSGTLFADIPLRVSYQEEPRGLAHAVAAALVEDDALVMVGDVVYQGGSPSERMMNLVFRGIDGCVAVELVSADEMHLYGIVEINDMTGSIIQILEKPSVDETHSRWAVAGRWAFNKNAMALLADYCEDPVRLSQPKEINLTEVINAAIAHGMDFKAVALQPNQQRVDCGSAQEYAVAKRLQWD